MKWKKLSEKKYNTESNINTKICIKTFKLNIENNTNNNIIILGDFLFRTLIDIHMHLNIWKYDLSFTVGRFKG